MVFRQFISGKTFFKAMARLLQEKLPLGTKPGAKSSSCKYGLKRFDISFNVAVIF